MQILFHPANFSTETLYIMYMFQRRKDKRIHLLWTLSDIGL